jgi:chromosome segregation ATPase
MQVDRSTEQDRLRDYRRRVAQEFKANENKSVTQISEKEIVMPSGIPKNPAATAAKRAETTARKRAERAAGQPPKRKYAKRNVHLSCNKRIEELNIEVGDVSAELRETRSELSTTRTTVAHLRDDLAISNQQNGTIARNFEECRGTILSLKDELYRMDKIKDEALYESQGLAYDLKERDETIGEYETRVERLEISNAEMQRYIFKLIEALPTLK